MFIQNIAFFAAALVSSIVKLKGAESVLIAGPGGCIREGKLLVPHWLFSAFIASSNLLMLPLLGVEYSAIHCDQRSGLRLVAQLGQCDASACGGVGGGGPGDRRPCGSISRAAASYIIQVRGI